MMPPGSLAPAIPQGGRLAAARHGRLRGRTPGRACGFTLAEVMIACAVAALLAAVALPWLRGPLLKAHRTDGVGALMKLQAQQERLRSDSGLYAADLAQLKMPARSDEGLYALAVELTGPDSYRASASVVAGTPQAADRECAQITLEVNSGFATTGPSPRCWNR